jgi:hypothetical protein
MSNGERQRKKGFLHRTGCHRKRQSTTMRKNLGQGVKGIHNYEIVLVILWPD